MSPGTMVHVMHVLFMFLSFFKNLISSVLEDNMPVYAIDVLIGNATQMVWIIPLITKNQDQTLR